MVRLIFLMASVLAVMSCANTHVTLYDEIGGKPVVENIVDNFITEIEYDPEIIEYFVGSDIDRFRTKLIEQICFVSKGPCQYTGDSMSQVHAGMKITEKHFNRTVDLLINAMTKAGVSHPNQNRLLAELAPMRKDMLYK